MNEQRSESRDRKAVRIDVLLRQAVPPVGDRKDVLKDLWPAMQRRLQSESAAVPAKLRVPWFDWALAGALVASLALFPAWIPVLLYYL